MSGGPYETIVIDDGSSDGTAAFVAERFPSVHICTVPPSGLSAARNKGAALASGEILAFTDDDCEPDKEWIARLDRAFQDSDIAAAGGPNLPPPPQNNTEAVVCSAPGAPSHVLLDDTTAEHIPGCNLAVRKHVFHEIGGFDPAFRTAGDDVDFCWRLSDNDFRIGFIPGAFVWHWRRPSMRAFLAQQKGYGKAEKLLITKHPERFTKAGEARWKGFVYGGGAVRITEDSVIYHGAMGQAGYQRVVNRMLPLRPLPHAFQSPVSSLKLRLLSLLQPMVRRWYRNGMIAFPKNESPSTPPAPDFECSVTSPEGRDRIFYLDQFLSAGWKPGGDSDPWDLEKSGTRLLIATERMEDNQTRNLFRVWGDAKHLSFLRFKV